jgi:hypothetical protein
MLKVILKTLLGLLVTGFGFFLAYFYITEAEKGLNALIIIPSIILICVGVYLLIRAGKSDATVIQKAKLQEDAVKRDKAGLEAMLKKNNDLSSQWSKTVDKRDRLKLLEISAAAAEESDT